MSSLESLSIAWTRWLAQYNWQWFVTLTFQHEVHPEAARKRFGVLVHKVNQQVFGRSYYRKGTGIYWVLALEYQKRGVIHFHALFGADQDLNHLLSRKEVEQFWKKIAGFARIYPITNRMTAVTAYISKYVVKDGEIEVSETLKDWCPNAQTSLEFGSN